MPTCQTLMVTVRDPETDRLLAAVTMPAFTRAPADFTSAVMQHAADYLRKSEQVEQPLSVADFALYLTAQAANEPKEV